MCLQRLNRGPDVGNTAANHTALSARSAWSLVGGLALALAALTLVQLPGISAADQPPSLAASAAGSPVPAPAELQRLPGEAARARTTDAPERLAGATRAMAPRVTAPGPAPPPPAAHGSRRRATAPERCSGGGWQQRRGQAALASLAPGARDRTDFRLAFRGARSGILGLTHLTQRRIEIFVRPCATESDELLRHVLAHELGHAYDTARMTATTRRTWMAVRGIPAGTSWYGCSGCSDFATPAGDFAEVYAQWARGASTNRSRLAGDVPPAQLVALAQRFFGA